MEQIDKIYVLVHPEFEKIRHERLKREFEKAHVPGEKIIYGAQTWGSQLNSASIFNVWDPYCRRGVPALTWKCRCLSKGEISLVLNFYFAAMDAVKNGYKNVLIFESDTYLRESFLEKFADLMEELKEQPWDYVSLGEGIGTRPPNVPQPYSSPTKVWKPPHFGVFRCTDSMLFKVEFLAKVVQTLIPFRECLDWELNYQLGLHKGVGLWVDPPLAEQGSGRNRDETLLPA